MSICVYAHSTLSVSYRATVTCISEGWHAFTHQHVPETPRSAGSLSSFYKPAKSISACHKFYISNVSLLASMNMCACACVSVRCLWICVRESKYITLHCTVAAREADSGGMFISCRLSRWACLAVCVKLTTNLSPPPLPPPPPAPHSLPWRRRWTLKRICPPRAFTWSRDVASCHALPFFPTLWACRVQFCVPH